MTPLGCILSIAVLVASIAVFSYIKFDKRAKKLEKHLDDYREDWH